LIEKFLVVAQGGIHDRDGQEIETNPPITKIKVITLDSLKRILRFLTFDLEIPPELRT
jgi:hypothetical protein